MTERAYYIALSMFAHYQGKRPDRALWAWARRQGLEPLETMDDFEHVLTELCFGRPEPETISTEDE